jgi:hypothetical protein
MQVPDKKNPSIQTFMCRAVTANDYLHRNCSQATASRGWIWAFSAKLQIPGGHKSLNRLFLALSVVEIHLSSRDSENTVMHFNI